MVCEQGEPENLLEVGVELSDSGDHRFGSGDRNVEPCGGEDGSDAAAVTVAEHGKLPRVPGEEKPLWPGFLGEKTGKLSAADVEFGNTGPADGSASNSGEKPDMAPSLQVPTWLRNPLLPGLSAASSVSRNAGRGARLFLCVCSSQTCPSKKRGSEPSRRQSEVLSLPKRSVLSCGILPCSLGSVEEAIHPHTAAL